MKYNIYGRTFELNRNDGRWTVFALGADGKKRISDDIFIPSHVDADGLEEYLEDLLHEWAITGNDQIFRIE